MNTITCEERVKFVYRKRVGSWFINQPNHNVLDIENLILHVHNMFPKPTRVFYTNAGDWRQKSCCEKMFSKVKLLIHGSTGQYGRRVKVVWSNFARVCIAGSILPPTLCNLHAYPNHLSPAKNMRKAKKKSNIQRKWGETDKFNRAANKIVFSDIVYKKSDKTNLCCLRILLKFSAIHTGMTGYITKFRFETTHLVNVYDTTLWWMHVYNQVHFHSAGLGCLHWGKGEREILNSMPTPLLTTKRFT